MVKYIVLVVAMYLVLHLSNALQLKIQKIGYFHSIFDTLEKGWMGKEVLVGAIQNHFKSQIDLTDGEWERLFRSVDDDHSGTLNMNEFCRLTKNINLFIESDLNKDGVVDISEANTMLSNLAPKMMTDTDKRELIEEVCSCGSMIGMDIDVPDVSYLWKIVNCFKTINSGSNVASYAHLNSWMKANNYEVGLAGNDFRRLMKDVNNKGDKVITMRQFARILLGRDIFKAMDVYGALDVTEEEVIKVKRALNGWSVPSIKTRFSTADWNRNKRLDFLEFMHFKYGVNND